MALDWYDLGSAPQTYYVGDLETLWELSYKVAEEKEAHLCGAITKVLITWRLKHYKILLQFVALVAATAYGGP